MWHSPNNVCIRPQMVVVFPSKRQVLSISSSADGSTQEILRASLVITSTSSLWGGIHQSFLNEKLEMISSLDFSQFTIHNHNSVKSTTQKHDTEILTESCLLQLICMLLGRFLSGGLILGSPLSCPDLFFYKITLTAVSCDAPPALSYTTLELASKSTLIVQETGHLCSEGGGNVSQQTDVCIFNINT